MLENYKSQLESGSRLMSASLALLEERKMAQFLKLSSELTVKYEALKQCKFCAVFILRASEKMFIQNDLHQQQESVGCSSGYEFIFGVGGLRFKSRADQIGHSLANSSPSLQYFFESSCMPTSAKRKKVPPARSGHWRNQTILFE